MLMHEWTLYIEILKKRKAASYTNLCDSLMNVAEFMKHFATTILFDVGHCNLRG